MGNDLELNIIKKNFQEHTNYLKNICETNNINFKNQTNNFIIYPDKYNPEERGYNYLLIMIERENHQYDFGTIQYKDCSRQELVKHLIDFKNGIVDNQFCLNNTIEIYIGN